MIAAPALVLTRPKERAPYTPYGAARQAWYSSRRELLLCGPSNTGKSRAALEKLHYCMDRYKGARGLMLRKTMKSLRQTGMVTYEKKVLPQGWLDNLIHFNTTDQQYEYPNGSIIAVAGLDDPQKVMSSEWDMIYPQEATELSEDDWQALSIRMRWHHMPYQQMLADCNPGRANHWLKARCDRGQTLMLHSRHADNPAVMPEDMAALDALTGVWYRRYRLGQWASAEGAVYDEWDPSVHIIDRFEIPPLWPRYWAIDWGFRNPACWSAFAESHDGDLYCYREIYRTGMLVEDLARQVLQVTAGDPRPVAVICDHDAGDRATFEKHSGMSTTPASKSIDVGIKAVKKRLRSDRRGRPTLFYLRDSLVETDPVLEQKKLPLCTTSEYESYEWDTREGRKVGELPVDKDNHGMDTTRYMVMHVDGGEALEELDPVVVAALSGYRGY